VGGPLANLADEAGVLLWNCWSCGDAIELLAWRQLMEFQETVQPMGKLRAVKVLRYGVEEEPLTDMVHLGVIVFEQGCL
jgi:hypothetical protein